MLILCLLINQDRSGMLNFKKYVVGRCSLSVSIMKFTRPDAASWKAVKDNLQLTLEELECLNQFTDEFDQHGISLIDITKEIQQSNHFHLNCRYRGSVVHIDPRMELDHLEYIQSSKAIKRKTDYL